MRKERSYPRGLLLHHKRVEFYCYVKKEWADSTRLQYTIWSKKIYGNNFYRKEINTGAALIITKNVPPSKWESIEGERVGMVGRHYSESFLLVGEFKALGDGVVKSNRLMECHERPAFVMSLVNTATWPHRRGRGHLKWWMLVLLDI